MSTFSFSTGESRIIVMLDETAIVLASDQNGEAWPIITRRQKAIAVALLETAIAEIQDRPERAQ